MTTLYIRTHKITKLKYFGKSTRSDLLAYKGSGLYWKRHLKKYGTDIQTEIVGIFEDNSSELISTALKFSKDNNIVKSDKWANLIYENGLDGGSQKGRKLSKASCEKFRLVKLGVKQTKNHIENNRKARIGRIVPEDVKKKMRKPKSLMGKENIKKARIDFFKNGGEIWNKGIKRKKTRCPHCNILMDIANIKRYHFDNCKFK